MTSKPARLDISQIFIPNHKQAANFVSIYQETLTVKEPVSLFLIVEIRGDKKIQIAKKREEFEKITKSLVANLKQTYLAEQVISEETFEKALNNLNNTLSNLARRGVVAWFKHLNALVAVVQKNSLFASSTGSMSAMLLRHREFSQICHEPNSANPHPLKTFGDFSSGELSDGDFVILATKGIFNFLALDRLQQLLIKEKFETASKEIVEILKTDSKPIDAFAGFACNYTSKVSIADEDLHPLISPQSHTIIEDSEAFNPSGGKNLPRQVLGILAAIGGWLAGILTLIMIKITELFRAKKGLAPLKTESSPQTATWNKRKQFVTGFVILVVLLLVNLIYFNFRNAQKKSDSLMQNLYKTAEQKITEAEAALIYNNEKSAMTAVNEAEKALSRLAGDKSYAEKAAKLAEKIDALSNQLNKISEVKDIEELAAFSQTPDRLVKTASGFLGFNSYTDSYELFDDKTRTVQAIRLSSPSPENLIDAAFLPAAKTAIFLGSSGRFYSLGAGGQLAPMFSTSTPAAAGYSLAGLKIYENKAYSLDTSAGQILRFSQSKPGSWSAPETWLKKPADFSQGKDLALDGNIYAITAGTIQKFTKGEPQAFSPAELKQGLKDASKIFTEKAGKFLYISDPKNSRIVIFNKDGSLAKQLTSPRFSELKDAWADETAKTIYAIAGNSLVRFKF